MSNSEHAMGHIQDQRVYLNVLLTLLALTIITVVASRFHFGPFNTVVAIGIAAVKASFVVLYFMHGKYEGKIVWAFVYYPLVLLMTLVAFLFIDYGFRSKDSIARQAVSFDELHAKDSEHGATHDVEAAAHDTEATSHDPAPEASAPDSEAASPVPTTEPDTTSPAASAATGLTGDLEAGKTKAKTLCIACHKIDGVGNELQGAPPFSETANDPTKTPEYLRKWLKDPQAVKPGTLMPNLALSDQDIENMIVLIQSYK